VRGQVKGIIIKYSKTNQWYAGVQCDTNAQLLPRTGKIVGIDLGVLKFAHDSNNYVVENPKYIQQSLGKLKSAQRALSRKQEGSQNRKKAKAKLVKLHEHVVNQRKPTFIKLAGITSIIMM